MKTVLKIFVVMAVVAIVVILASYFYLPVNRIGVTSELVMLGDLNGDNKWDDADKKELNSVLDNPFSVDSLEQLKIDVNRNDLVDAEDLRILEYLYTYSNPYLAERNAKAEGMDYPKPRELFKYLPKYEYVQRPLFALNHRIKNGSPLLFLRDYTIESRESSYNKQLLNEIYNEALRFTFAYDARKGNLTEIEVDYANRKIGYCNSLLEKRDYYELLLTLIGMVEDAETLTVKTQNYFVQNILLFREKLRALLASEEYELFTQGKISYSDIFNVIEEDLLSSLGVTLDLNTLPSPRDFTDLKNYLDRAEWQAFKSKTESDDFRRLVLYAQYDRRYLRAVSRTSPKREDVKLENHNLPMILLFREALRIENNDKKSAVGLLDEAIRIPMGWVKSIPKDLLPSSVALDNFLLPGNKEDGTDKTRHWNVFGGVAIYKSPEESLILALKREIMDLRDDNYSEVAMREFIRDTIANINGIYYVVSIDPNLLREE